MRDDLILYFNDVNIPCKSEVIISLANEESLDFLDIHNTVRINCNPVTLGATQKIIRLHSLNMFEYEDKRIGGTEELKDSILDTTTTMLFNYLLADNDVISSVDDLLMVIEFTDNIKNMANAAFFSVTKIGINFGLNYIKHKAEEMSGNATYALSAIVQKTPSMSLDMLAGPIKRILEEPSMVREI